MEKSRRERRKEARLEKSSRKHQLWLQRQKDEKLKKSSGDLKLQNAKKSNSFLLHSVKKRQQSGLDGEFPSNKVKDDESDLESPSDDDFNSSKVPKRKKGFKRNVKTNFEKFLEMEAEACAEEDLELERKLAKKLTVKSGKLKGDDDEMNLLFGGIPSVLDSAGEDQLPVKKSEKRSASKKCKTENSDQELEVELPSNSMSDVSDLEDMYDGEVESEEVPDKVSPRKKNKKRKLSDKGKESNIAGGTTVDSCRVDVPFEEVPTKAPQKYVAPHLRSCAGSEPEEYSQIRRRVRGLLNRLSESNVESITGEMSGIFRSVSRSISSQIIGEEVLASCSRGPRGNEQYAAVFAAFVAGMACSVGVDFSAKLMASLAKNFEDEYRKHDNLSLRNLTLLLSYLCLFGVCSSDLIYDFMSMLSKRLAEVDISTILTVLQCCGMKIRADDPLSMKNFILGVQSRVTELKASSGEGQENINSKRMEFMLETICDIKNNKKRSKEDPSHHTRIKKWLQKLGVEEKVIRGLKWSKLLDPDKKGQWWSSVDMTSVRDDVDEVASTIDKEVLEAQKMLELAAAQRMNTQARKAIFCIIMSGEDYIDAFEKLLRLDLPGKQDREIMRVLVECCLQEKVFNKYYAVLATKLCEHDKNHKFTLQFCLWDHFKEVESMPLIRSMNLARFVAEMIASFCLSLAVLKAVDLNDITQLTPKRIMHFRMLFEAMFEYPDKLIWNVFTRVAVAPELEDLRQGIEFFVKEYLVKSDRAARDKFKVARKALTNAEGILM
ncbi:Armadillo-type fold containing protein [Parasponia andersonii]|uniref:Armadillo-type fold containing protein n=1 Tax=Parasponia andersonii TaxID=3476 RepID=A0A2P5B9U4_PARAD|nr:Armadillo-type fold containing protein [Parasponia andersonii]